MTRFHIEHRTTYRYTEPVRFGLHRIVLRPREGHRITVVRHELQLLPVAKIYWMNDLFGNHVALAEIVEPADQLEIVNDVVMDRISIRDDEAPLEGTRCSLVAFPVTYPQMEKPVVQGYLEPNYPDEHPMVQAWVDQVLPEGHPPTALAAVTRVCRAIYETIRYRRREEPGVQTPATTLRLGTGSCRDMATLLIEACRVLGVASRFVSGYLDAPASAAGRGATHAWTEVYLPDCGWCGFDPTLGEEATSKQIALGVSAHPRGVMPVSGIFTGSPGCYLGMEVKVSIKRVAGE